MSQVKLSVGGRSYTVSCADGEEAHVADLGASIDARIAQLGPNTETQNLLFGGLLLADELHELRTKYTELNDANMALQEDFGELESKAETYRKNVLSLEADGGNSAARIADAERELERLTKQIAAKDTLLERANAHMDELKIRLSQHEADAGAERANQVDNNQSLAVSLESFADLLENCADKLECNAPSA